MIVSYRPELAADFARLNRAWLERYFTVEPLDEEYLGDPEGHIVNPGDEIFFAVEDDRVLGTCAAIRQPDGSFELAKLAVTPEAQGPGNRRMPTLTSTWNWTSASGRRQLRPMFKTCAHAVAFVILIGAGAPVSQRAPTFQLPVPTGPFTVATTSWYVIDSTRTESFAPPRTLRMVEVIAFYPSTSSGNANRPHAPYLRESYAESQTFAQLVRRPGVFDSVASVETHSYIDRPVAPTPATFPVLIFSHGYTGASSAYTALLEDLASHGYVVLSIVHPYESVATRLQYGQIVTMLDSAGAIRRGVLDVLNEWGDEDSTMARVTRATEDAERVRILRGYFGGLNNTHAVIDRWVRDTKLVLDKLQILPATSIGGELARRVDFSRVGVFGHSMGGVVAGQFCVEDRRCRAGLNLDGIPQSGTMIDSTMPSPFLMVYSMRPGRLGANDVVYRRAAARYYRVDVDSTRHLDFSEMPLWGGPLSGPNGHGAIAPARAVELTRMIVREYFDQELRGRPSALLDRTRQVAGVEARRLR